MSKSKSSSSAGNRPPGPEESELPDFVRSLFWDYDEEAVSWPHARDLIIRRVLSVGPWHAVTWLRAELGDAELRRWIEDREGRPLDPQQLRFWELILDLPSDRVERWLADEPRRIWAERTSR